MLDLSSWPEPANKLIDKVCEGIGGLAAPWQIRRVARAEADAAKIEATARLEIDRMELESRIELQGIQRRALARFVHEETRKQENIEAIVEAAIPQLEAEAKPEEIDDDWMANFLDRCRLVRDKDMQAIWSRIMAGEANSPGTFSKRTVNFVQTLDSYDGRLFTSLCSCCFHITADWEPLVFDTDQHSGIYADLGLDYANILHLAAIGLINVQPFTGYVVKGVEVPLPVWYFGTPLVIEDLDPRPKHHALFTGYVTLTKIGEELAPICGAKPIPGFIQYAIGKWAEHKTKVRTVETLKP